MCHPDLVRKCALWDWRDPLHRWALVEHAMRLVETLRQ